jgi:FkbH-like protein
MTFDRAALPWLPPAPEGFRQRCRAAPEQSDPVAVLRHLSGFALDDLQLGQLAGALRRQREAMATLAPLIPLRLGILSNATQDHLAPALEATGLRFGFDLQVIGSSFGETLRPLNDPQSFLARRNPDFVLIGLDARGLGVAAAASEGGAQRAVEQAVDHLARMGDGIRRLGARPIWQTLAPSGRRLVGNGERLVPEMPSAMITAVNDWLFSDARGDGLLLDVGGLASSVGSDSWADPLEWTLAKFPFASRYAPLWADHLCRLLAASHGLARKCLVLDLDNTVWGGAVGDDGIEGLVLGPGSPLGEAFVDIQETALALRARGVVLAVCSKNDEHTVLQVLRDHPEMRLRPSHIACLMANWQDKAANLRAIATALNLGLDGLVMLDDNPAERAHIRSALPMVAVPELPDDPAYFSDILLAAGYFESLGLTAEDRARAASYAANLAREQLRTSAVSEADYLRGLDMVLTVGPFTALDRPRIQQLFNKTNQFNLTTHRVTEAQVAEMETDPNCFTLSARLRDRLGDNGLISVVVCRCQAGEWQIESWLMSCRVLGRRVEQAMFQVLAAAARRAGATAVLGLFRPTEKNALVRGHYAALGFELLDSGEDGSTSWRWDVTRPILFAPPITIETEVAPP